MAPALTLLDGVRWQGEPVVGSRPQSLLAALAAADGRAVRAEQLVSLVWGEDLPANASKALQVLVSRTRSQCDAAAIGLAGDGYRLGLAADQVDTMLLAARVREAAGLLTVDAATARDLAAAAVVIAGVAALARCQAHTGSGRPAAAQQVHRVLVTTAGDRA